MNRLVYTNRTTIVVTLTLVVIGCTSSGVESPPLNPEFPICNTPRTLRIPKTNPIVLVLPPEIVAGTALEREFKRAGAVAQIRLDGCNVLGFTLQEVPSRSTQGSLHPVDLGILHATGERTEYIEKELRIAAPKWVFSPRLNMAGDRVYAIFPISCWATKKALSDREAEPG